MTQLLSSPRMPDVLNTPVDGDFVAGVPVEPVLAEDGVLPGLVLAVGVGVGGALLAGAGAGFVRLDRVPVVPVDLVRRVEGLRKTVLRTCNRLTK